MIRIVPLLGLLAGLMVLSLFVGVRQMTPEASWQALNHFDPANGDHLLVWRLRVPRALLGAAIGAAMGLAAVLMQGISRNPLADPGILGVNAGAALAVVAALALGIEGQPAHVGAALLGAALAGAAAAALGRAAGGGDPTPLVLGGAALSAVLIGVAQSVILGSDPAVLDRFRYWAAGSLQGRGMDVTLPLTALTLGAGAAAMALAPRLDAMALGRDASHALGAGDRLGWLTVAGLIVTLAGAATAVAGPIAFAGLLAAHLARGVVGPVHRRLLPCAMLTGGTVVVAADILARIVARPAEIETGIVCALLGAPFFLWLVRSGRSAQL